MIGEEEFSKSDVKPFSFRRWIVLGVCSAFVLLVAKTCTSVHNEKWAEASSVYNIQDEIQWGRYSLLLYSLALKAGFAEDSLFLQPLIKLNDRLYESGISKIPETDSERARLWYQYKFRPFEFADPRKYADRLIIGSLEEFQFLSEYNSKSEYFDNIESKYILLTYVYNFFQYRNFSSLNDKEKNAAFIPLTKWLLKTCDSINVDDFLKYRTTNGRFEVPLDCLRWKIEYSEYSYKNGIICNEFTIKDIIKDYKKMYEMAKNKYQPRYIGKDNIPILNDVWYMLENYKERIKKITNSPNHCKE